MSDKFKIEDLSVGDWAICNEGGMPEAMRVVSVGKQHIVLSGNGNSVSGIPSMIDFAPVPLSGEILKANGFERTASRYECYAYEGEEDNIVGVNLTDRTLHIEWEGYRIDGGCKYVHELQRALRSIGMWYSSNNFNVSKNVF